jgi:subfamily B ATP-binding cassette protein MsbA
MEQMQPRRNSSLRRYLAYARPYKWVIALMMLAGVAKFTLPMIPAWIFGQVTNAIIANSSHMADSQRYDMLWTFGIVLLSVALLEAVAIYVRGVISSNVSAGMAFDIRQDLWRHLQRLGLSFHRSRPSGSLMSRLMSDISVSQQMVNGGIVNVVIDGGTSVVAVAVLFSISWKLALIVLAVLPFYGLLYRRVNPRIRQVSEDVQEQTSVMSGMAVERLAGIALVQSFAQERHEEQQFAEQADELRELNVRRGKLSQLLNAISDLLVQTGSASVWIVGAALAIGGGLSAGEVIWFTGTMGQLYMPMRRFSEINIIYQTSMNAIDRIFALFDIMPDVQDKPNVADRTPGLGGIEFDNVEFRYGQGPAVLKGVSLKVAPGERVAIVGESGAGKSTLVTLIPRLYDVTGGAIRVDGVDLRDYPLRKLRRSIGIVLQDVILFSGTVRENLRYGRKKATDAEIFAAARAANAHDFIASLPDGYDTMIGERGMTLSGGQRQRISLARAILQNPRILILDEATSSLDSESENLITEALQHVMEGRTCVIIAHRLSTVINADRILVFREGKLVEDGPHEQLLARGGYYRYLFEQQFGPLQELIAQAGISRQAPSGNVSRQ